MNLKNRIGVLAMSCCLVTAAYAVPANPKPVTLSQPDGTTITVRIHGDEHRHWLTDANTGRRLVRDDAGFLVEAPREEHVASAPQRGPRRSAPLRARTDVARSGDCNYLVVLVGFQDTQMTFTRQDFDRWLNVDGYYGTGSVKQYWEDNSAGKFRPDFTVVGPYNLSHNTAYYGAPDHEGNYDVDPRSMVMEAVLAAKADNPALNFAKFDNDGDGLIDNCYIIYAGYSQASSAVDTDIWPHSWYMADESLVIDGVAVYNYSCSQELVGGDRKVKKMDGIGTFTHEFGHILGLSDLYDTDDYDNGIGIHPGHYSLYASGSYNNDSKTPAGLWAFERNQMGWLDDSEMLRLTGDMDVQLQNFVTTGQAAYIDCLPGLQDGKEWLIMENRQQTGWDKYIPAHGLLIYHYDYTPLVQEEHWAFNGPNNYAKHPCVYIKAADGTNSDLNRDGDTWPGLTGASTFTDDTQPSARNWDGQPTQTPLTNIRETADGVVEFQVGKGKTQWDVIRALKPQHVRYNSAQLHAEFRLSTDVREYGIAWNEGRDNLVEGGLLSSSGKAVMHPNAEGKAYCQATKMKAGTWYCVRPYVVDQEGRYVYGSSLNFQTDYAKAEAPFTEFFADDYDPETELPNTWEFYDGNGDGTVWQLSTGDGAIFYEFDYWNDADDWLISRRQWHVPANGLLTFVRGVMNTSTVESLEVYVSTGERKVEDFVLHKQFSFADYFGNLAYEEVDLSAYAGKDVYLAFRCTSEKLQDALWLFAVSLTSKLEAPRVTRFAPTDATYHTLEAQWTSVPGATKYYLWFGRRTDEEYREVVFVPANAWVRHSDTVTPVAGGLKMEGNGEAVLRNYQGGIHDLRFLALSSGPQGTSYLHVEGTKDGVNWMPVGQRIVLGAYDSEGQEIEWTDYVKDAGFTSLRFRLEYGGRSCRIKYLTIEYGDGNVYENLAAGAVYDTQIKINEMVAGEFQTGDLVITVASGDNTFFYEESEMTPLDRSTGIHDVRTDAQSLPQPLHDLLGRRVGDRFRGIVINPNGREAVLYIPE